MGKGIPGLDQAYQGLLTVILVVLAIMLMLCLIRAIIGPKIADRVVSVNMMGTMVMVIIGILAVLMQEGFLADVCMIYAMISFLAVIVLTKVYTGVYLEKQQTDVDHNDEVQGIMESAETAESMAEQPIVEGDQAKEEERNGSI